MTTRRLKEWAREHIRAIRITIVVAMFVLATIGFLVGPIYESQSYIITNNLLGQYLGYFLANLGPELAGIVIGVVVIDALNDWRQTEQLKAQLIRQMGSQIRDMAVPAVRELKHHGWLYDGSLEMAHLEGAHLEEARLIGARLEGAHLYEAHLERAILQNALLERADLRGAHLEGTDLRGVHLEGVEFLTSQQLRAAKSVTGTTMPDGVKLKAPYDDPPYLEGPTLEEWLATKPDCLDWSEDEEE